MDDIKHISGELIPNNSPFCLWLVLSELIWFIVFGHDGLSSTPKATGWQEKENV